MDISLILFALLAGVLALVGIVGSVLPALPGPPISWVGLLVAYLTTDGGISTPMLLWMLALTIVVTVLDYVAPIFLTKVGGGSKAATWGSTIGMVVGLFFMPWGLLLGPLVGAFLGEMKAGSDSGKSMRVALMSFVSFLLTTGLKLIACLWMAYVTMKAFI